MRILLPVVVLVLVSACNRNHSEDPLHEGHTLNLTLYTSHAELFAEFPVLVSGDTAFLNCWLTQLYEYIPITGGELTVSLRSGGKDIASGRSASDSHGIYRPFIIPDQPGMYQFVFTFTGDTTALFIADSIRVYNHPGEAEASLPEASVNAIHFTKEQARKIDFKVITLELKPFSEVIHTSGQIVPANGDEITLVAPYAGIVSFSDIRLVPGNVVHAGDKLLFLTGKGLAGENISVRYASVAAEYEKARIAYEQRQELFADKIISERSFLETKKDYELAKAAFMNLNPQAEGDVQPVITTSEGFVKRVFVSEGSFVEAGSPLVCLSMNKRLMIRADVSQTHWQCLPRIKAANFLTPYDGKIYNTNEIGGKLVSYGRNLSNASWSVPVYFEIDNTADFISGAFIEVYLMEKPGEATIALPAGAITEEQGTFFVYVQRSGELYDKREVKTGVTNGFETEIISGIRAGERVVIEGAHRIKLASMASALPAHDHNH
jgi:RND family efflux transporter MFP subunit